MVCPVTNEFFSVTRNKLATFFCFLLQIEGATLNGQKSTLTAKYCWEFCLNATLIATGGFYTLVTKYNGHADLIILVAAFLIYPNTNRRNKLILELWNIQERCKAHHDVFITFFLKTNKYFFLRHSFNFLDSHTFCKLMWGCLWLTMRVKSQSCGCPYPAHCAETFE